MCLLTLLSSHTALGVTFQTINTVTLCVLGFGRTKRLRTNYFINLYQMKDLLSLCAVFFFFFFVGKHGDVQLYPHCILSLDHIIIIWLLRVPLCTVNTQLPQSKTNFCPFGIGWLSLTSRTSLCFRQTLFCRSSGQRWCQYLQCLSSTLTAPFQCEAAEDRALLRQLCSLHTPQLSTNQCYYATWE